MSNKEKYKIYDDVILKYELLIEKEVDSKKLKKMLEENSKLEAYYLALKYINVRMRSELEIRKYLYKYDYQKVAVDYAVLRLKEEGYIDEERYVEAFLNDSLALSLNGPKKIESTLESLGLDSSLIASYIEKVPREEWTSRIEKIISKRAKVNKYGERMFKSKMYSELSILGFYAEDIMSVLEGVSINTDDAFLKEADKIYRKLLTKYEGVKLEYQLKSKLYSKGFTQDQISEFIESKKPF